MLDFESRFILSSTYKASNPRAGFRFRVSDQSHRTHRTQAFTTWTNNVSYRFDCSLKISSG